MRNVYISLNWYEYFIWLLYVVIGCGFLYIYKSISENKNKYLFHAYFVKIFGGFLFALVYVFYYKLGDTTDYYLASKDLSNVFYSSPLTYFKLLISNVEQAKEIAYINKLNFIYVQWSSEEYFMARISSTFNILGFNSYLGMTYFFSLISFFGTIRLKYVFDRILPNNEFANFLITFLPPSVLIWGSGVLKDTFTLVSFSLLCYLFYKVYTKEIKIYTFLLKIIIPSVLIINLKPYIIVCMIPFLFITIFFEFINKSKHPLIKFIILPYIVILFSFGIYFSTTLILNSTEDYKKEKIFTTIEGFYTWHKTIGGSAYDLGDMEYTEIGLLIKLPAAVNVTLFRPYLWECKTVLSIFAGLESFIFFSSTIYVLIRYRINFFLIIYKSPYLFGLLMFVIIFAFILGVTAYNFGALVRFKIPLLSPLLFLIYYSNIMLKKKNNEIHLR